MSNPRLARLALTTIAMAAACMGCPKSSPAPVDSVAGASPTPSPAPPHTHRPVGQPMSADGAARPVRDGGREAPTTIDATAPDQPQPSSESTDADHNDAPSAPIDSRVEGVQSMRFPLRAFSSEDQEKAIASVRKAARWVRRGAFDKAIEAYKTAVALDANSWSRYELITTYLRAGERRAALGMLKELREWADSKFECVICMVWLRKSTSDALFESIHEDPRYRAMVDGLSFEEPDYRQLTRDFLLEVSSQQRGMLKASLERRMVIRVADANRSMDAKTGAASEWEHEVHYFDTFESIEKSVLTTFDEPQNIRCQSRCCRLTYRKRKVDSTATKLSKELARCDFNRLERICFWPFEDKQAAIVRLDQRLCEVKTMGMEQLIDRIGKPGWIVPKAAGSKDTVRGDELDPPGKPLYRSRPEEL